MMENLKKEAYKIRMSAEEKSAMQAQIFSMSAKGESLAREGLALRSPYFIFNFQFTRTASFALAMLLLVGTGTTYAAEGALPGDALYTVKININEAVVQAVARSSASKAEVHVALAERRVDEAQTLAAKGRLDAVVAEELAANLETHVAVAEASATEADKEELGKAREVRAKLAATLEVGGAILAEIGKRSQNDTKENSEELAVRLIARSESDARTETRAFKAAAPTDTGLTMALSASTTTKDPAAQKDIVSLQADAVAALSAAQATFSEVQSSLGTPVLAQVGERLAQAEGAMAQGSTTLSVGAYAEAEAHFAQALRSALMLQKLLAAHAKFDGDLISPILKNEDEVDDIKIEQGVETRSGASVQILNTQ